MATQAINLSRRNLFRGRADDIGLPLRPPGAIRESIFTNSCTSCDQCVTACPQGIVFRGSGGYPEVDFRHSECTFCMHCIDICPEGALLHTTAPPWRLQLPLGNSCLALRQVVCQTCADSCEAEAIRFQPLLGSVATPLIDQDLCTGCGACIAACPEHALKAVANG